MTEPAEKTKKDVPSRRPPSAPEIMEQILYTFAVQLTTDPAWQGLLEKVPREGRRKLAKKFANHVLTVRKLEVPPMPEDRHDQAED